jgi:pimeloyl-ACP methyl ester carboxylesterase
MTTLRIAEPELVASFDSTVVAVRTSGEGEGTPLLAIPAVGATMVAWARALVDVGRERRVVSWDLRGLHESGPPESDRLDAGAHAEDAIAALEHAGVDRFLLAAWSSGARIALEIAHRYPERVASLAVVSGGFGHAPGRLLRYLELQSALPVLASAAKHFSYPLQVALHTLAARPEIGGIIRQSGMIAAPAETSVLVELLRGAAGCDLRMLLNVFGEVAGDDASALLPTIEAPTLLVVGERDQFTPRRMMEQMARAIPRARLEVYDHATHYLPIEYPARLGDDLRRFWRTTGES